MSLDSNDLNSENNYDSELLDGLLQNLNKGSVVSLIPDTNIAQLNARLFDPSLDLGVVKVSTGNRNDPRMIVVNDKVVFIKKLTQEETEKELIAHDRCKAYGINHFVPAVYTVGERVGYFATYREFVVPISKIEVNNYFEFEAMLDNVCNLVTEVHKAGIYHGDAKGKNFAVGEEGLYVYDWETARFFDPPLPRKYHNEELNSLIIDLVTTVEVTARMAQRENKEHWANANTHIKGMLDLLKSEMYQKYISTYP